MENSSFGIRSVGHCAAVPCQEIEASCFRRRFSAVVEWTVDGVSGVAVEYAYVGDTLVAERRGNEWVPMVYGANLLQRGGVNQYWTWREQGENTYGVRTG